MSPFLQIDGTGLEVHPRIKVLGTPVHWDDGMHRMSGVRRAGGGATKVVAQSCAVQLILDIG